MRCDLLFIFSFGILLEISYSTSIICEYSLIDLEDSEIFREKFWKIQDALLYRCEVKHLNIKLSNQTISSVEGNHINNYSHFNVQWLEISKSVVYFLPHGFDNFFKNIKYLNISGINLLELDKLDLQQFPNLSFLFAFDNELTELKLDTFDYNLQLIGFNFNQNRLRYINHCTMRRILSRNKLTDIYVSFQFNSCTSFKSNRFEANSLFDDPCYREDEILCEYFFDHEYCKVKEAAEYYGIEKTKIIGEIENDINDYDLMVVVQVLKSNFTRIPEIFAKKFKNLDSLELSGKIQQIDPDNLKKFSKLIKLNLANNEIGFLSSDNFIYTPSLKVINLSNNKIMSIGRHTFTYLVNITSLVLINNPSVNSVFQSFAEFKNFYRYTGSELDDTIECRFSSSNFRYCGICYYCEFFEVEGRYYLDGTLQEFRGISGNHFKGKSNKNVEAFVVKYSEAKVLYPKIHHQFPNLKLIRVTKSKLMYIHNNGFHGLNELRVVDMSHNKLMELPKGIFDKNEKLIYVDFSYNRILRIYQIKASFTVLRVFKIHQNFSTYNMEFRKIDKSANEIFKRMPKNNGLTIKCYNASDFDNFIDIFNFRHLELTCSALNLQQISEILEVTAVYSDINKTEIKKLYLRSYVMYFLPTNISKFLPNLEHFEAIKSIRRISRDNFAGLSRLEKIILKDNNIEFIDDNDVFSSNPNLKFVSFKNNGIKRILENVFDHLKLLEKIDLVYNFCSSKLLTKIPMIVKNYPFEIFNEVCGAKLPGNFVEDN